MDPEESQLDHHEAENSQGRETDLKVFPIPEDDLSNTTWNLYFGDFL